MHFTQIEIERELSDAFPQGKRTEIAGNAHIYPSVLLGWFNPDDERKSPHYQVLAVQAELDEAYPKIGDDLWSTMCRLREQSRPGPSEHASPGAEIGRLAKEVNDLVVVRLESKSLRDQYRELTDIIRQLASTKAAMERELRDVFVS